MSKSLRLVLARERCTRGGAACPIIVQKQHVLGPLQRHIAGHTSGLTIMVSFVAGVAVQESCAPLAITAMARKTREAPQPATKPFPSRMPRMPFPGWLPCSRRCHSPAFAPRRSSGNLPLLGLVPPLIHPPSISACSAPPLLLTASACLATLRPRALRGLPQCPAIQPKPI